MAIQYSIRGPIAHKHFGSQKLLSTQGRGLV